jgi:hypothetical protein
VHGLLPLRYVALAAEHRWRGGVASCDALRALLPQQQVLLAVWGLVMLKAMLALLASTTQVTTLIISLIAQLWEGADARACKCMACYLSDLLLSQPGIDGGAGLLHVMLYGLCHINNRSHLLYGGLSCSKQCLLSCPHHTGHHTHHLIDSPALGGS